MPTRKSKRERTKEFLEAALERARKVLNPRDFAVIFQSARGSAGGQISARRRRERMDISAAERQLIEKTTLREMNNAELRDLSDTVSKAYDRNKKRGNSLKPVISRAKGLLEEFRRREIEPEGSVYVELSNKTETRKGFLNGEPEGGMHAHGLDRRNEKTLGDGSHIHLFVIPGTGEVVLTSEDGWHEHSIEGDVTARDGQHSHRIILPNGAMTNTKLGGEHSHELMIETSGLGGLHKHTLVLPDGNEIESMSPSEFLGMFDFDPSSEKMPPASVITGSFRDLLNENSSDHDSVDVPLGLPDLEDALDMVSKGKKLSPPLFALQVLSEIGEEIELGTSGEVLGKSKNDIGADAGDIVDVLADGTVIGLSQHSCPDSVHDIQKKSTHWELISRHTQIVPFTGPEDAKLLFVATAPNDLEVARKKAIVGEDAIEFQKTYLDPIGISRDEVAVGFAMPVLPCGEISTKSCDMWKGHLIDAFSKYSKARVVALGKCAREVLSQGGISYWTLPHPSAVRKRGDTGEVSRKLRSIQKALDGNDTSVQQKNNRHIAPSHGDATGTLADVISEMRKTGQAKCRVVKTADEKQIVYGVVLDPYSVDLQTDWVPPAEIESTAHGFMKKSRVIGFEHMERANAQLVESWVEPYPSREDYLAAMENRPHRAFTRRFGNDTIHSGTWMAGVQLGDKEWEDHKAGRLNAFSVGGFSFKTRVTTAAMPDVEFVELIEASA